MRISVRAAVAASALIAFAGPAAAQSQPAPDTQPQAEADAQPSEATDVEAVPEIGSHIIVIGAIKNPADAHAAAAPEDSSVPELPVVYEGDDGR